MVSIELRLEKRGLVHIDENRSHLHLEAFGPRRVVLKSDDIDRLAWLEDLYHILKEPLSVL